MSLYEHRAARNEAMFRAVNEEINELQASQSATSGFVCECSKADCTTTVELSGTEYESVRANPRRFFVAPGHEDAELERVVERNDSYFVVEKDAPAAAAVAERTDPRS